MSGVPGCASKNRSTRSAAGTNSGRVTAIDATREAPPERRRAWQQKEKSDTGSVVWCCLPAPEPDTPLATSRGCWLYRRIEARMLRQYPLCPGASRHDSPVLRTF